MLSGAFPTHHQHGSVLQGERGAKANMPIAGGWRGGFESWTGDWKERVLSHNFQKRNYMSTKLCDLCEAVQPHPRTTQRLLQNIYTDFSLRANWTRTLRSHEEYLQTTPQHQRSPWLDVAGFDTSRVRWDSAHTVLLGIGKDIAGSFLLDLASRIVLKSGGMSVRGSAF